MDFALSGVNANLRRTIGPAFLVLVATLALVALAPRAFAQGGIPLWTNRYDGPGNNNDSARSVAVDASGNVFVTGASTGFDHYYDYATIKYSPTVVLIHLAVARGGGGGFFICVTGVADVAYRLQRATSLTGPWTSSAPQTAPAFRLRGAPAAGFIEYHETSPPPGQAFYRAMQP